MSHHTATLQSAFDKTASVLDFAYTVADRLYWLDDNYVQPFYSWAAPRLRDVAISGLYWALVTLIDIAFYPSTQPVNSSLGMLTRSPSMLSPMLMPHYRNFWRWLRLLSRWRCPRWHPLRSFLIRWCSGVLFLKP